MQLDFISTDFARIYPCYLSNYLSLLWCVCMLSCFSHDQLLQPYGPQPTGLFCPWDSPGKNTGLGFHALLQGIFPTQASNRHLLHLSCIGRWVLYQRRKRSWEAPLLWHGFSMLFLWIPKDHPDHREQLCQKSESQLQVSSYPKN